MTLSRLAPLLLLCVAACDSTPPGITPTQDAALPVDAGVEDQAMSLPDGAVADGAMSVDAAQPIVYGLPSRPANATCKAFTAPPITTSLQLVDKFPNVPVVTPTGLFQRPGDNARWYATERGGRIVYFPNDPSAGAADMKTALDLRTVTFAGSDCAMSAIAFPANFATSKHAYVSYCYMGPETANQLQLRVSRFATPDGGNTFDVASEQVLFSVDFPYDAAHPTVGLHSIDAMRFGTDGYLYFSVGDGGPQGSGGGHQAQDTSDLRGKLHRIDVSDFTKSLSKDFVANRQRLAADIPPDNPFVLTGGAKSIYAYGFRNPWQWNFDRLTNQIWLGDVGNNSWEEIDRGVVNGGNYGWGVLEGTHCTGFFPAGACTDPTLHGPLLDYSHGAGPQQGNAVTGGVVYRGTAIPSLYGAYVFGDSSAGRVWAVPDVDSIPAVPVAQPVKNLLFQGAPVSSFAQDQNGEIFLTILYGGAGYTGRIFSLEAIPPAVPDPTLGPPAKLSQTGCFDAADPSQPMPGVVPFAPSAQLWSDGATKRRWMALPDDKQITVKPDGDFDFPIGSVLMKEFSIGAQKVETRFFVRQEANGVWAGYTYLWSADQTDATLAGPDRGTIPLTAGGSWAYPGRADCFRCHTNVAGTTLGPEIAQLNHAITYPSTGLKANQLETLAHIGYLDALPVGPLPNLPPVDDALHTIPDRARAYLHANCSNCHRPDGPTFTPLDLRYSVPLSAMGICDAPPTIDALLSYIPSDPRLFAPGDPLRSVLWWRLSSTDPSIRMPPIARTLTHATAAWVVGSWITSTPMCP